MDELSPLLLGDFAFRMLIQNQPTQTMGALRNFCMLLISTTSSPQSVVMTSIVYINRLRLNHPEWLNSQSHGLSFTVCLMLAFKFIEDAPYLARSWSKASGFTLQSINLMERQILERFDYHLLVHDYTIRCYQNQAKNFYLPKPAPRQRTTRYHPYAISRRPSVYYDQPVYSYSSPFVVQPAWPKPYYQTSMLPTDPSQISDFIHSISYPSM